MADYLVKRETVNYGSGSWAVSLYLRVEQIAQSIDNNTTTLRLGLYVVTPSGYPIDWGDWDGSYLGVAAYNGRAQQKTTFTADADGSGTMWLKSGVTVTVSHAADGSAAAAPIIWKWGVNSPWGQYVTPSGTKTLALPTIPRATTPTVSPSSVTMGNAVTISTPRASSSFTHTLTYSFGSSSGTIATGVATSQSWTPPVSLAAQIPYATSGSCTITCKTYSGSTLIGTKTVSLTLNVPASVVPTISAVSIAEATAGLAAQFGAYVQNKSTLAVNITASGAQGSTISTYRTTIQGVSYTAASFTSRVLAASGASTISVIVTDSRGRTASYSASLTVLEYFAPRINSMSAWRVNTSGTADDEGERVAVAMAFEIAEVGTHNNRTFSLQYRKQSEDTFQTFSSGTASWTYDGTRYFTTAPELSPDYAYVIRLTVTDYFGGITKDVDVPTAFVVMDFRNTGKGLAVGKVSEKDAFEIAMNSEFTGQVKVLAPSSDQADAGYLRLYRADGSLAAFLATSDNGDGLNLHLYSGGDWSGVLKFTPDGKIAPGAVPMTDFVVDQGTSGIWSYQKWNSGVVRCHANTKVSLALSQIASSGVYTAGYTVTLPFSIISPVLTGSSRYSTGLILPLSGDPRATGPTNSVLTDVYDFYARNGEFQLTIDVVGRWK